MTMKAIIFGASGQDGFYLTQLLQKKKVEVVGVDMSSDKWIKGDVGDFMFVFRQVYIDSRQGVDKPAHGEGNVEDAVGNKTCRHKIVVGRHQSRENVNTAQDNKKYQRDFFYIFSGFHCFCLKDFCFKIIRPDPF